MRTVSTKRLLVLLGVIACATSPVAAELYPLGSDVAEENLPPDDTAGGYSADPILSICRPAEGEWLDELPPQMSVSEWFYKTPPAPKPSNAPRPAGVVTFAAIGGGVVLLGLFGKWLRRYT